MKHFLHQSVVLALSLFTGLSPLVGLAQSAALLPAGVVAGSGPGVHSPDSPFAPLPQRSDVVPWSLLTAVTLRDSRKGPRPAFNAEQLALHFRQQRVQGFMMPLEPGEKQKHFLLSSVPMTCAFCVPGGPESMVEVFTKTPVKYSLEPVAVEGRFAVLEDDPYGLYYRVTDAVNIK
jgi:hypothetical protein